MPDSLANPLDKLGRVIRSFEKRRASCPEAAFGSCPVSVCGRAMPVKLLGALYLDLGSAAGGSRKERGTGNLVAES